MQSRRRFRPWRTAHENLSSGGRGPLGSATGSFHEALALSVSPVSTFHAEEQSKDPGRRSPN